jgi:ribosome-associated protein
VNRASKLVVNPRLEVPFDELHFTYARSSGPGGQNVNKVNTKAVLRWSVRHSPSLPEEIRSRLVAKIGSRLTLGGDLVITSQRFRDAGRNAADCLEKLRTLLAEAAIAPKQRKRTRPGKGAIRRRLADKRQQGEKKRGRRGDVGDM